MSNPNIVSMTSMYGTTAVQAMGVSATAIVTNSSGSNTVVKVDSLYISNVDGTNNYSAKIGRAHV